MKNEIEILKKNNKGLVTELKINGIKIIYIKGVSMDDILFTVMLG